MLLNIRLGNVLIDLKKIKNKKSLSQRVHKWWEFRTSSIFIVRRCDILILAACHITSDKTLSTKDFISWFSATKVNTGLKKQTFLIFYDNFNGTGWPMMECSSVHKCS